MNITHTFNTLTSMSHNVNSNAPFLESTHLLTKHLLLLILSTSVDKIYSKKEKSFSAHKTKIFSITTTVPEPLPNAKTLSNWLDPLQVPTLSLSDTIFVFNLVSLLTVLLRFSVTHFSGKITAWISQIRNTLKTSFPSSKMFIAKNLMLQAVKPVQAVTNKMLITKKIKFYYPNVQPAKLIKKNTLIM